MSHAQDAEKSAMIAQGTILHGTLTDQLSASHAGTWSGPRGTALWREIEKAEKGLREILRRTSPLRTKSG